MKIIKTLLFYKRWIVRFFLCSYKNNFYSTTNKTNITIIDEHRKQNDAWEFISKNNKQSEYDRKANLKLELIKDQPKLALEIGCESGWFGEKILNKFPESRYIGIDFRNEEMHSKENPKLNLITADARDMPIKNKSVDLLLAFHVLEHITDIDSLKKQIDNILTENAKIILCMPLGYDEEPCHRWHYMTKHGWIKFIKKRLKLKPVYHMVDKTEPSEYIGIYTKNPRT